MEASIFLKLPDLINDSEKELWIWKRSKFLFKFIKEERTIQIMEKPLTIIITSIDGKEVFISPKELRKVTIFNRINLTLM